MGLPPKILQRGVKDRVRISDARMSGTAPGALAVTANPERQSSLAGRGR
jgi:L-arabonate dehydrase